MSNNVTPKVVVFASSIFSQNILMYLMEKKYLVGIILPDPSELGVGAIGVDSLAAQLKNAGIPYQCCCEKKLPLIVEQLDAWQASLGIVATYPHILPAEILDYFGGGRLGIYNVHASNLPDYVGPCPVYWQIRNNEKSAKIVLHRVERQVDSGDIVASHIVEIDPLDTLPSLTNRLAYESCRLVAELLESIDANGCPPKGLPQKKCTDSRMAPRANLSDYRVDFDLMGAEEISAMCRAGNGLPYGAVISVNDVDINVVQATPVDRKTYGTKPGTIIFIGEPEGLIVCVNGGALRLDILAGVDGIYSGLTFAERFHLDAGVIFNASSSLKKQA